MITNKDKQLLLRALKRGLRTGGALMVSAVALGLLDVLPQLDLASSEWGALLLVVLASALTALDKAVRDRELW